MAALAAGLASVVVHATVEVLAAATGGLPEYLIPVSWESASRYMMTFAIQAVVLVAAYLIIGSRLPGRNAIWRCISFGTLVFLLGACLPLAPMSLVFREPFLPRMVIEGLLGGAVLSFAKGMVFVAVWENVARRMQCDAESAEQRSGHGG